MRTVNIGKLKNELSAYLKYVQAGEEVIVKDRDKPVARILPFPVLPPPELNDYAAEEAYLVATGQMKPAEKEMDWDAFWALPAPDVPDEAIKEAIDWAKGDR